MRRAERKKASAPKPKRRAKIKPLKPGVGRSAVMALAKVATALGDQAMTFQHDKATDWQQVAGARGNAPPAPSETAEIVKLARGKNPLEAVENKLMMLKANARYGGMEEAEEAASKQRAQAREVMEINVISAFMARLNAAAKFNGGPLPLTFIVDGYTLARVCDALHKAGYDADGLRKRNSNEVAAEIGQRHNRA